MGEVACVGNGHEWIMKKHRRGLRPKLLVASKTQSLEETVGGFIYMLISLSSMFGVSFLCQSLEHSSPWLAFFSLIAVCFAIPIPPFIYISKRLIFRFILVHCDDCGNNNNNSRNSNSNNITTYIKSIWLGGSFFPGPPPMISLGSCNGLVAIAIGSEIYLTNPTTRFFTKVLDLRILLRLRSIVVSGLSHNEHTGDYKVVLISRDGVTPGHPDGGFAIVGSCKTKEWREVPFPSHHRTSAIHAVDFRSTLHFMVADNVNNNNNKKFELSRIVYFDPTRDEFRTLPAPEPNDRRKCDYVYGLGVIDDRLCMGRRKFQGLIEVLVMEEYGVKESWVIAFVIDKSSILYDRFGFRGFQFYSADENQRKVTIIHSAEIFEFDRQTNNVRRSLVPLKKSERGLVEARVYFESLDHPPQGLAWERNRHCPFAHKVHWLDLP